MDVFVLVVWQGYGSVSDEMAKWTCREMIKLLTNARDRSGQRRVNGLVSVAGGDRESLERILRDWQSPDVVILASRGLVEQANRIKAEYPDKRVVVWSRTSGELDLLSGIEAVPKARAFITDNLAHQLLGEE